MLFSHAYCFNGRSELDDVIVMQKTPGMLQPCTCNIIKVELCVRMGRTENAAVTSGEPCGKKSAPFREIRFHKPEVMQVQY